MLKIRLKYDKLNVNDLDNIYSYLYQNNTDVISE